MTTEKLKLRTAEATFKSVKRNHPVLHKSLRDELIRTLAKSKTPDFGSLRFTITKGGV